MARNNLVFCRENGTPDTSDALNWRFSKMTRKAGIGHWHAHEGRHTAVSIMSSNGVPIQEIGDTAFCVAVGRACSARTARHVGSRRAPHPALPSPGIAWSTATRGCPAR